MSVSARRIPFLAAALLLFTATMMLSFFVAPAYASSTITSRSLTLEDGASDAGSKPSGDVNHKFSFKLPASATAKSIVFKYCTTADIDIGGTCTTPHGLSTTSVTLGAENGDGSSFDTLNNTTNGAPYIDSTAGIAPAGGVSSYITLDGVTNPDGTDCASTPDGCTFYVAIQVYDGTGGTGTLLSSGTVAASVNQQIQLSGTMPESLIFCTGGIITLNGNNIPDCSTATSGSVTFNKLFSPTSTAYATSQMAASTNALSGYAITLSGETMKSGSNTIAAVGGTATASSTSVGSNAFGVNLVADTDAAGTSPTLTSVGEAASASITPTSNGATGGLWGAASANFDTDSDYAFDDTGLNNVAASDFSQSGTAEPTNGQIYTATYMVNVAANLPAGTYTTTLTYICTPTF